VEYTGGTGAFTGITTGRNSQYKPANSPPLRDHHATDVAAITDVGFILAKQAFTFNDLRTGATDITARNSGFHMTRNVTRPTPTTLSITTTKTGTATTSRGHTTGAGAGTATSGPQAV
jgi:hypothetical protein